MRIEAKYNKDNLNNELFILNKKILQFFNLKPVLYMKSRVNILFSSLKSFNINYVFIKFI